MDLEEPLFSDILLALLEGEIVQHLVQVILHRLPLPLAEIPVSLLCRLTLSGEAFVDQFVSSWHPGEASAYLSALLQSQETPTIAELLSLLGQVARASGQNLPFLTATLGGPGLSYQPLQQALDHHDKSVRAKACGLAGKLLGQGQGGDRLLEKVLERLWDDDPAVRGSASFAAGNAAYRAGSAPQAQAALVPALPRIVGLLDDPRPRTRRNAASALGNLGSGSGQLGRGLLRAGAPQHLLELACRDSQACVREAALAALRAMSQWPQVREVLISLRSCEKLSVMCQRMEQKATLSGTGSVVSPRSSAHTLLHHCNRLRDALTPTLSD
ncbi:serine/threonine-protein kinase 36-like [Heterodontus francisci]|uniref:serine/threonine-protein kinase 36-like n=1 Tax=Heterodontus francisci TaxID=7792 RepID=UPI00355B2440